MGLPSWGGVLFGSAFLAVGTFIILAGTKALPVNPSPAQAPGWVLTAAGTSFVFAGLMIWGATWTQISANRRRLKASERYSDEPALADYHWHPEGFQVSAWTGAAKAFSVAIGVAVFLSIFNWWAFWANGPWMVKAIVALFDCFGLALWWWAARQLGHALKFGHSRIDFTRFPYRVSEPVIIRWRPNDRISEVLRGTFTLRCVEEWTESRGRGKTRHTLLIQEEIWSAKWIIDKPRKVQVKDSIELRYDLPEDARTTDLRADRPIFWELDVQLDLPGLDFRETYLVPIYGSKTSSSSTRRTLAPITLATKE